MATPNQHTTSTGFVSLGQYLDANRNAVDRTGQSLLNGVGAQAQQAQQDSTAANQSQSLADYSKAQGELDSASQNLAGLNTTGGVMNQLPSQGIYTPGDQALDANLVIGDPTYQKGLQSLQSQYGGLDDYLNNLSAPTASKTVSGNPVSKVSKVVNTVDGNPNGTLSVPRNGAPSSTPVTGSQFSSASPSASPSAGLTVKKQRSSQPATPY